MNLVGDYFEKQDLDGAGENLLNEVSNRWLSLQGSSIDDITFIIVFFSLL